MSKEIGKEDVELTTAEIADVDPETGVKRGLRTRHVSMIALAGIIGSGLIVGSGNALELGGPASTLICVVVVGFIVLSVMQSIGETVTLYPGGGGFLTIASRFVNRPLCAVICFNYFVAWIMVLANEYNVLTQVLHSWGSSGGEGTGTEKVPIYGYFLLFFAFFQSFQMLGVKSFGEAEFWLALVKILALIAFYIFALIYVCGGIKNRPAFGFHYFNDPGAFHQGFRGLAQCFVFFSTFYVGTEAVALTATEARNPGTAIPKTISQVMVRILLIYVLCILFMGMTCPYDDPQLSSGATKALLSPMTIAIQNAGLEQGYHIINVLLLVVLLSAINSSIYFGSRSIFYLADNGLLPPKRFWTYTLPNGVPLVSVTFAHLFGFLSLMNMSEGAAQAYTYITNLSGISIFIVWAGISFSHLRFRRGWRLQGYGTGDLPYKSFFYPITPLFGLVLSIFLAFVQGWTTFSPFSAGNFVDSYILLPVSGVIYIVYGLVLREFKWKKPEDMDFTSGKRADLDITKKKLKLWELI